MDEFMSKLRLLVWYDKPATLSGVKVFLRQTMDFGDTAAVPAW